MSIIETPDEQEPIGPDAVGLTQEAPAAEAVVEAVESGEVPFESLPSSWQEEVKKLRQEAADRRVKLHEYEGLFEGFDETEAAAWQDFIKLQAAARRGDPDAIAALQEIMAEDDEEESEPEPETQAPPSLDEIRRLAREEAEAAYAQREQVEQERRAVEGVMSRAREMGYETERGKPGFEDYQLLTYYAMLPSTEGGPDVLKRADEMVKAHHRALIDKYLTEKGEVADQSIATPAGNGASPGTARLPFDPNMSEKQKWNAVRGSLTERLKAQQ